MFLYSIGLPMVLSHYFQSISQCVLWIFQVEKYGVTLERFSLLNYLNFNVAICVFIFCFRILLLKIGFLAQYMEYGFLAQYMVLWKLLPEFRPGVRHSFSRSLPLARRIPHVGPGNGREGSRSPTNLRLADLGNVIGIFGRVFHHTEKKHQVGWR